MFRGIVGDWSRLTSDFLRVGIITRLEVPSGMIVLLAVFSTYSMTRYPVMGVSIPASFRSFSREISEASWSSIC